MDHHTKTDINMSEIQETFPQQSEMKRVLRVMFSRWVVVFGCVIVGSFLMMAAVGPLIAPYDPYEIDLSNTLANPSKVHLLGTDSLGRDTLSRIIYGSRISLMVGVVAVSIAAIIGMTLGLLAGYFGLWVNNVIMRLIDALMAIPPLVLALSIAAFLGGGLKNVMIAIGVAMTPTYSRLMCGLVLSIKEADYVLAVSISGGSDLRIMLNHLLRNAFPPLLVLITLNMGFAILFEAGLSFIGIGITAPEAAWGSMVSDGYKYLLYHPTLSIAPGVLIMLVVFSFNIVGDGLRDALDPKLRGTV